MGSLPPSPCDLRGAEDDVRTPTHTHTLYRIRAKQRGPTLRWPRLWVQHKLFPQLCYRDEVRGCGRAEKEIELIGDHGTKEASRW